MAKEKQIVVLSSLGFTTTEKKHLKEYVADIVPINEKIKTLNAKKDILKDDNEEIIEKVEACLPDDSKLDIGGCVINVCAKTNVKYEAVVNELVALMEQKYKIDIKADAEKLCKNNSSTSTYWLFNGKVK